MVSKGLLFLAACGLLGTAAAATFGTVVVIVGEPSDLVLDEARSRLYVVNSSQNRIEVYSPAQKALLNPIAVDPQPISAAMSRNGNYLYVTSYAAGVLDVIDLTSGTLASRVSLPASPEGVAVGADERVLITSPGTGTAASPQNTMLLYDPASGTVSALPISLPGPATPTSTQGVSRSRLIATPDGSYIIGLNNPSTSTRQIFVYETASASILRSRTVSNISSVLSVSADGSRFMAGLSMFETATLLVVAQQNSANSVYPFPTNANFNTQSNQGGSVFAPDGSVLYTAFNFAPVNSTQPNVSQLMLNDPDNLLINLALQLPENLIGRMVITADGGTIYALSQSGFTILPVSTIYNNPIAVPQSPVVLVTNDQCGVTAATATAAVPMLNLGTGRFNATAQPATNGVTATQGLGGFNGPGGGGPGGGFPIILPGGGGTFNLPGGGAGNPFQNTTTTTTSSSTPLLATKQTPNGTEFDFSYNPALTSIGTPTPTDFYVTAAQAINVPPRIRVMQNNRNAEAAGAAIPIPVGVSATEGLMDIAIDNSRQKIYIANSGMNRVEVFDIPTQQLLAPIKVGQLPHSLALSPDGGTMYVANTGGESISMVDLDQRQVTGKVKFPLVPFNASASLVTPSAIAAAVSGLQMVMSDGSLWSLNNAMAAPRAPSSVIGSATVTAPRSMIGTPDGRYVVLLAGNGTAYLYDAMSDAYVISEPVVAAPIQGYYGVLGAANGGAYYLINGYVVNGALAATSSAGTIPSGRTTVPRPVSAAFPINGSVFARFVQPTRTGASTAVTGAPTIELVDVSTGNLRASVPALEGPLATQVGTQRANVSARMMAVDSGGTTAYLLTASGLSIVPLGSSGSGGGPGRPPGGGGGPAAAVGPQVSANGVVNIANYSASVAPGSLISIFGQNLASSATASGTPLPSLLGGACVTLDNSPLPLLMTSATQINAQLPPKTTAARHSLVVRSIPQNAASFAQTVTVAKYAPAVLVDPQSGQAAIYHSDGKPVTPSNATTRDQSLTMYATGLGATTGGTVTAGMPSPSNPLAVTGAVQVYFGDPSYSQSAIIVNWSGLVPGMIGLYQINVTVPGTHMKGDTLPVTVKIGGVSSPTTGSLVPAVAVN